MNGDLLKKELLEDRKFMLRWEILRAEEERIAEARKKERMSKIIE